MEGTLVECVFIPQAFDRLRPAGYLLYFVKDEETGPAFTGLPVYPGSFPLLFKPDSILQCRFIRGGVMVKQVRGISELVLV